MNKPTLFIGALVLVAGGLLFGYSTLKETTAESNLPGIRNSFPSKSEDWVGTDLPLANTPDALQQTVRLLNYDEAFYRVYRKGSDELGIYIAYWKRNKMSVRDVASHVPDICWGYAGWELVQKRTPYILGLDPAQNFRCDYRVFRSPAGTIHVAYWHVLDGNVIRYGADAGIPWWTIFTDVFRYGFGMGGEQYFVRITSSRDLDVLRKDPTIRGLIETAIRISGGNVAIAKP